MAFVKGFNREKAVGYYNTDVFESIRIKVDGANISVCGYIYEEEGFFDIITLREEFPSKEEAETWLLTKAKEWGIVIADPNH